MAGKCYNPYTKAYSFGTDGSAALAGNPISSQRPVNTPKKGPSNRPSGIWIPRWIFYGIVLLSVVILSAFYLDSVTHEQNLAKELTQLQADIMSVQGQVQSLQDSLAAAADETRIRSIAVNRLGMQLPVADQVVMIPAASAPPQYAELPAGVQQENAGFFQLLLSTLGL